MVNIGDQAPLFALPNQTGDIVKLEDFTGQALVIFSFPQAGTPGCTTQACTYRDTYSQFEAHHACILGLSASTMRSLRSWKQENQLPFDLLSDEKYVALKQFHAWGLKTVGVLELPYVRRCFWVIDSKGIVQASAYDVDPVQSVYDSLSVIQNLKQ